MEERQRTRCVLKYQPCCLAKAKSEQAGLFALDRGSPHFRLRFIAVKLDARYSIVNLYTLCGARKMEENDKDRESYRTVK